MTLPHHLVTVWNPSYAQDAMDEHLGVRLSRIDRILEAGVATPSWLEASGPGPA